MPSAVDHINFLDGANVELSSPITIQSMRVASGATLTLTSTLTYVSGVAIDHNARVVVNGGSLRTSTAPVVSPPSPTNTAPSVSYPTVTVAGVLDVVSGSVAGAQPSASGDVEFPSVIAVMASGALRTGAQAQIQNARVLVTGSLQQTAIEGTPAGSLALAFTGVEVTGDGRVLLAGTSVSADNSVANRASSISVTGAGGAILDGSTGKGLTVAVPITVGDSATLSVRAGAVTMASDLDVSGRAAVAANAQLVLASSAHTFQPTSTLTVAAGGVIGTTAGQTLFLGAVNTAATSGGTLVVASPASVAANAYLGEVVLRGSTLSMGSAMIDTEQAPLLRLSRGLTLEGGALRTEGAGSTRNVVLEKTAALSVSASAASKSVQGLAVTLLGKDNLLQPGAVLVLGQNAQVSVETGAALTLGAGASLMSDATATRVTVAEGGALVTGSGLKDTLLDVELVVKGQWQMVGDNTNTMTSGYVIKATKPVQVANLAMAPENAHAHLILAPAASSVAAGTPLALPASVAARNLDLELQGATVSLSNANWSLKNLVLDNSKLTSNGMIAIRDTIVIGGAAGPGALSGGAVTAAALRIDKGTFAPLAAAVSGDCPAPEPSAPQPEPETAPSETDGAGTGVVFPPDTSVDVPTPVVPTTTTEPESITPATPFTSDCGHDTVMGARATLLAWIFFGLGIFFLVTTIVLSAVLIKKSRGTDKEVSLQAERNTNAPSSVTMASVGGVGNVRR